VIAFGSESCVIDKPLYPWSRGDKAILKRKEEENEKKRF
jgi:hypothetical protein